jgi:hypothetical protein
VAKHSLDAQIRNRLRPVPLAVQQHVLLGQARGPGPLLLLEVLELLARRLALRLYLVKQLPRVDGVGHRFAVALLGALGALLCECNLLLDLLGQRLQPVAFQR